ncbi:MAG TPA: hypothetical protein V6D48_23255 [Oculatellaceae cyanobacterium]
MVSVLKIGVRIQESVVFNRTSYGGNEFRHPTSVSCPLPLTTDY